MRVELDAATLEERLTHSFTPIITRQGHDKGKVIDGKAYAERLRGRIKDARRRAQGRAWFRARSHRGAGWARTRPSKVYVANKAKQTVESG